MDRNCCRIYRGAQTDKSLRGVKVKIGPNENRLRELEIETIRMEIKKVDPKDALMKEWYEQPKKNNIYEMRQQIKGRALIINNSKFDKQPPRSDSHKDVEGLEKVFKGLSFHPEIHQDLSCEQMAELLRQECQKDHSDYNCFFLVIMTHGDKGVMYGTDGYKAEDGFHNSLNIEDVKAQFSKVQSLQRKPKVFVIEAYQGCPDSDKEKDDDDEEDEEEVDQEMGMSITPETPFHFLVAVAGDLSYHKTGFGSLFIQAFIFVLANYAWKEDLLTLMEKANELLRRAKTEETPHQLQVSKLTNTFIKKFFFFPGMPLETSHKT